MISLGMLSAYSAYTGKTTSVYGSSQVSDVKNKQDSSDADNSLPKLSSSDDINDEAIISDEASAFFEKNKREASDGLLNKDKSESQSDKQPQDIKQSKTDTQVPEKLSPEQQQEVAQLKARDIEVKAHEHAHIAAAAGLQTSAPSYDYEMGPDGQKYAVGGEVNISFSTGGDPEEDIANAEIMKAAALAPADPSGQDLAVAKNADKIIQEARQRLAAEQDAKLESTDNANKAIKIESSDKASNDKVIETDK